MKAFRRSSSRNWAVRKIAGAHRLARGEISREKIRVQIRHAARQRFDVAQDSHADVRLGRREENHAHRHGTPDVHVRYGAQHREVVRHDATLVRLGVRIARHVIASPFALSTIHLKPICRAAVGQPKDAEVVRCIDIAVRRARDAAPRRSRRAPDD